MLTVPKDCRAALAPVFLSGQVQGPFTARLRMAPNSDLHVLSH